MSLPAVRTAARRAGTVVASAALVSIVVPSAVGAEEQAAADINLRTPFDCGQVWTANTRENHNPQLAVDFQRDNAQGQNVRSSADGTVDTVADLGNESYGKYIVVDHGDGVTTLYAHLDSQSVSEGQSVDVGEVIGEVGNTGGSTGPHLHYEQREGGTVVPVVLNGVEVAYYGNTTITSSTGC